MNIDALKAALMAIPDSLVELPTTTVADGYRDALAKFDQLMNNSTHPQTAAVWSLLAERAQQAFYFEGAEDQVRLAMQQLVASL
jgi:hypothetical protein